MIAIINKGFNKSNAARLLEYNEEKVKSGAANCIIDNTFNNSNRTPESIMDTFMLISDQNRKISDNRKFYYLELNLHPKDSQKIDEEKFTTIVKEYMQEMGYSDTPYVCYAHHDKNHYHIHLVGVTVNFDGKKVKDVYNDYMVARKVCEKLEEKYNIEKLSSHITDKNLKIAESLNAKNSRKYAISNSFKKAYNDKASNKFVVKIAGDELNKLLTGSHINTEVKEILGEKKYLELIDYLKRYGHLTKLYKDEISEQLYECFNKSKTLNEYYNNLYLQGIYARKVYKNKEPQIVYASINDNYYIKETSLPGKFRYENLKQHFGYKYHKPYELSQEIQKKYIKSVLNKALENSQNFDDFWLTMLKNGVEPIIKEDYRKGTVVEFSFKLLSAKDGDTFVSYELLDNFSYSTLKDKYNIPENFYLPNYLEPNFVSKKEIYSSLDISLDTGFKQEESYSYQDNNLGNFIHHTSFNIGKPQDNDYDNKKKKKKKKKGKKQTRDI